MPAVITHYLFGKEVQRLTGMEPAVQSLFNWGAQGPDVFFFMLPLGATGRRLIKTGNSMHSSDVEKNFALMCDCCQKAAGAEKAALTSYIYGFLAHYMLDSAMHPFVYGMQRHFKTVLPDAGENYLHRKIETNLDILFLERLRGANIKHYTISGRLKMRPELDYVCRMYSRLIYDNYGAGIDYRLIRKAFFNMKSVYSFLYSPYGVKRSLIAAAERLAGHRHPEYAALSHTPQASEEIDFANKEKAVSEEGNAALGYDAFEIFDQAALRYKSAAQILCGILQNGGDFTQITGGINFEGEAAT